MLQINKIKKILNLAKKKDKIKTKVKIRKITQSQNRKEMKSCDRLGVPLACMRRRLRTRGRKARSLERFLRKILFKSG